MAFDVSGWPKDKEIDFSIHFTNTGKVTFKINGVPAHALSTIDRTVFFDLSAFAEQKGL